jgi:hypothetical protein
MNRGDEKKIKTVGIQRNITRMNFEEDEKNFDR